MHMHICMMEDHSYLYIYIHIQVCMLVSLQHLLSLIGFQIVVQTCYVFYATARVSFMLVGLFVWDRNRRGH